MLKKKLSTFKRIFMFKLLFHNLKIIYFESLAFVILKIAAFLDNKMMFLFVCVKLINFSSWIFFY